MGRRSGSATAISYSGGRLACSGGHFDMDMIRRAVARSRSGCRHISAISLQSILACSGAWISLCLHELHDWNQGIFGIDGGTIAITPSRSDGATILPVEVRRGGGSLIFSAAEKTDGLLLVHLTRMHDVHACVQLVFQGCARQFACYDPMTDMTLVGLMPKQEKPDGWVAVRLEGNPWHIDHSAATGEPRPPVPMREWQAAGQDAIILRLPA
ncbi:hypothetical protein KTQ54_15295 [Komagataeibacter oboediens]|nr:hypothetical protein [Komagataeibacter oboediens]MBV1824645.1 hypothetical protein [Komagataeibacter oboediens]GCE80618.1 hypothetical protein MSKU3_2093 [Komagataeibacter oboediens]